MKALEESISHWENIVIGKASSTLHNCSLCQKFHWLNCSGCPVKEKTNTRGCENTPYDKLNAHIKESHAPYGFSSIRIYCPECERLAREELEFLKSLREPEVFYKVGNKFRHKSGDIYTLKRVGGCNYIALIGNEDTYCNGLKSHTVCNSNKITQEEFKEIATTSYSDETVWTKVC